MSKIKHELLAEYYEGEYDLSYWKVTFTYTPVIKGAPGTPDDPESVDIIEAVVDEVRSPILKRVLDKLKLLSVKEYNDLTAPIIETIYENYKTDMASQGLAHLLEEQNRFKERDQ
jgi:hypothetical protein